MTKHKAIAMQDLSQLHSSAFHSATKSTPSWFSRKPIKPESSDKQEREEENEVGQGSIAEAGSSESEHDPLVTKGEKSSDEEEKKQVGKDDQTMDTSGEVRTCL